MIKYKFLTGDVNWKTYGGKFVSQKLNNGDFDYWLVLEVLNMPEATGDDDQPTYLVQVSAVSPDEAKEENLARAFQCCGFSDEDTEKYKNNDLIKVEVLSDYGVSAPLWNASGNNIKKLLKEAHEQSQAINGLFGFFMDTPKNMVGSTGWDLIAGNLVFRYKGE
jgi:hypothetical protein